MNRLFWHLGLRLWVIITCSGMLICSLACNRPADTNGTGTPARSSKAGPIVQGIALDDLLISFEIAARDAKGFPETIRVHYKNGSKERACVELPGPVRGELNAAYRIPSLGVFTQTEEDSKSGANGPGGMFLYVSDETAQPERASYAILEPGESAAREYSLTSMCMIGHGFGRSRKQIFPLVIVLARSRTRCALRILQIGTSSLGENRIPWQLSCQSRIYQCTPIFGMC